MRRNPELDAAIDELKIAGIKIILIEQGRHLKIRWKMPDGNSYMVTVSSTPSDFRSVKNIRRNVRRKLREITCSGNF